MAVKTKLKQTILGLVSRCSTDTIKTNISGNFITLNFRHYDGPAYVCGIVSQSALPLNAILSTTRDMLEERITTKANICNSLPPQRQYGWLCLISILSRTRKHTTKQCWRSRIVTVLRKFLLVSGDRSVTQVMAAEIYPCDRTDRTFAKKHRRPAIRPLNEAFHPRPRKSRENHITLGASSNCATSRRKRKIKSWVSLKYKRLHELIDGTRIAAIAGFGYRVVRLPARAKGRRYDEALRTDSSAS